MTFSELEVHPTLLENIQNLGFKEMFPVQKQSIPLALQGKDLVVQAKTGSGKTLAFAIPLCQKINPNDKYVQAIVLTPTRELAVQVHGEVHKISAGTGIKSVTVYGGTSMSHQIDALRKGAQIVVGTPGRIIDLMQRGELRFDGVKIAVLDEGDRMFDMGFKDDIEFILSTTPKSRQTLLFSATVPQEIEYLVRRNFNAPLSIKVGTIETDITQVDQFYIDCDFKDRFNKLCNLLVQGDIHQAIIFCNAKWECDKLARNLKRYEFKAMSIHGDLSQNQRDAAMDAFRSGNVQLLVATDIAARGLDISGVSHVINYHVPKDPTSYVHRIGRTARAGRPGNAITLLTPEEWESFRKIKGDFNLLIKPMEVEIKNDYYFQKHLEGGRGGPQDRRSFRGTSRGGGFRRREGRSSGGRFPYGYGYDTKSVE